MSRRQALGTLTNQNPTGSAVLPSGPLKASVAASAGPFKSAAAAALVACNKFNDENEAPCAKTAALVKPQDFNIFKEEEKLAKKEEAVEEVNEEEEEEAEEEQDEDYEDVDEEEEEEEEESEESEEDEEDEDEDEFEDISRLNLGEPSSSASKRADYESESSSCVSEKTDIMNMMILDSSANSSVSSPMMLDDTIKFSTTSKIDSADEEAQTRYLLFKLYFWTLCGISVSHSYSFFFSLMSDNARNSKKRLRIKKKKAPTILEKWIKKRINFLFFVIFHLFYGSASSEYDLRQIPKIIKG